MRYPASLSSHLLIKKTSLRKSNAGQESSFLPSIPVALRISNSRTNQHVPVKKHPVSDRGDIS